MGRGYVCHQPPVRSGVGEQKVCRFQDSPGWGKQTGQSHQVAGDLLIGSIEYENGSVTVQGSLETCKNQRQLRRFGRKIKGLESEGAGVERKRRPGEGMASAPSSHPQGGAGDHGTHWQIVVTVVRGENISQSVVGRRVNTQLP